jgi:hypothetical protein
VVDVGVGVGYDHDAAVADVVCECAGLLHSEDLKSLVVAGSEEKVR